ncbi:hypothetical protein QFZ36_001693 [Pseudarthrobacter siccitolerans]|uniref:Uncharacterized protein n=1 Tax=Pseudarthrobacter siccitolerans TaxID=861266 RepID=A0ABU0PKR8_9MICC|nr:IniB N-terminal domain-containing protein [Pseudarthrobacter siccitolerans]MDQ0674132.1 hypothetical protein [Pseudarthrobacter siccitolerans]
MTVASDLVRFLMQLFGDREATQEFLANPERVLEDHGLGAVCSADVDAAMPVVLDYAPVTVNASRLDRDYNTGGNGAATGPGASGGIAYTPPPAGGGDGGGDPGHEDNAHAIQQLQRIVNNYSYTSTVDDRDTITDQSVNQNIWADGDIEQWFDNDSVVASGAHAIAAGDDVDIDIDVDADHSIDVEDSYNQDDSSDNSIHAGSDVNIGTGETVIDDSFNTDVDIDADLDAVGNTEDNPTNIDLASGNDNSSDDAFNETDIDAELTNAGNPDYSDVTLDDVGNETTILDNVGHEDTELEDFGNGNSHDAPLTVGDLEDNNFAAAGDDAAVDDS